VIGVHERPLSVSCLAEWTHTPTKKLQSGTTTSTSVVVNLCHHTINYFASHQQT